MSWFQEWTTFLSKGILRSNDKYKSCMHFINKFLEPVYLMKNHINLSFVCVCLVGNTCTFKRDWHLCGESSSSLREKYFIK